MIITVDTETRGLDTRKFVCGCIITETGKELLFDDKELMWKTLIEIAEKEVKRGHKVYIYGHNHEFDFYTYGRNHLYDEKMHYWTLSPFIATYGQSIYFLDSYSIFRMSLEELGNVIGCQKTETHPKLLNDADEITEKDMKDIQEYCLQDTRIVMEALKYLKEKLDTLGYKPKRMMTAGQIAMSTFCTHLRKENLWWKVCDPKSKWEIYKTQHEEYIRTSFRGARNEAFKIGEHENVTIIDVNSLYPHIMSKMVFPDLKTETLIKNPLENWKIGELTDKLGFIHCKIEVPESAIGFLPVRHEEYILFPNQEGIILNSIWTTEEIEIAIKNGYKIMNVYSALLYNTTVNIFEEYMKRLYEAKKNANKQEKLVIKLMMNSLYGKFGQGSETKTMKFIPRSEITKHNEWRIEAVINERYMISKVTGNKKRYYVNPVISSLVTSGARNFLFDGLKKVNIEDLLYCDTDSIIMKNWDKYKNKFKIGKEMGEWKIENENIPIDIKGEKRYLKGDQPVVSGVRKRDMTPERFKQKVIEVPKMVSLKQGDMDSVGTFENITQKFDYGCKKDIHIINREIIDMVKI